MHYAENILGTIGNTPFTKKKSWKVKKPCRIIYEK